MVELFLPTQRLFMLFAPALEMKAVDHVYQLKRRPIDKALNISKASFEGISCTFLKISQYIYKNLETFLPGP